MAGRRDSAGAARDTEGQRWIRTAEAKPLRNGAVQVWRMRAEDGGRLAEACRAVLSPEEVERMERMRNAMARDEFVRGRGLVRMLVGAALERAPASLVFDVGPHGKPGIAGVEFNVSHSHGLVAVALCRTHAVGVDVERMDVTVEALEIARGSFAPEEIERIAQAGEGMERMLAFFRCWTGKEAAIKARGEGLSRSLDSFRVPAGTGQEVRVSFGPEPGGGGGDVFVRPLEVGEGFCAALAVDAPGTTVELYEIAGSGVPDGIDWGSRR